MTGNGSRSAIARATAAVSSLHPLHATTISTSGVSTSSTSSDRLITLASLGAGNDDGASALCSHCEACARSAEKSARERLGEISTRTTSRWVDFVPLRTWRSRTTTPYAAARTGPWQDRKS